MGQMSHIVHCSDVTYNALLIPVQCTLHCPTQKHIVDPHAMCCALSYSKMCATLWRALPWQSPREPRQAMGELCPQYTSTGIVKFIKIGWECRRPTMRTCGASNTVDHVWQAGKQVIAGLEKVWIRQSGKQHGLLPANNMAMWATGSALFFLSSAGNIQRMGAGCMIAGIGADALSLDFFLNPPSLI